VTVLHEAESLDSAGFVRLGGPFPTAHEADQVSSALIGACRLRHELTPLSVIGSFVLAPPGSGNTRDFQTLHFDFGLPLNATIDQEVARYTALYIPGDARGVQAVTRLVPLTALLSQRTWPPPAELVKRLTSYGRTHGARNDDGGYVEGSLARIIEAAAGVRPPVLPSVKVEVGFLCGLEFDSLLAEVAFFALHGLYIEDVEIAIDLRPGELLVFDNLAVAHGRRGMRKPGEMCQRMFGQMLEPTAQMKLRDKFLEGFARGRPQEVSSGPEQRPCALAHEPAWISHSYL
jgi:Taurine catabolism dioxygenase TauD, TfdA family